MLLLFDDVFDSQVNDGSASGTKPSLELSSDNTFIAASSAFNASAHCVYRDGSRLRKSSRMVCTVTFFLFVANLLQKLMKSALKETGLKQYVDLRRLEYRMRVLHRRVLEVVPGENGAVWKALEDNTMFTTFTNDRNGYINIYIIATFIMNTIFNQHHLG